jgi:hypothetical protein
VVAVVASSRLSQEEEMTTFEKFVRETITAFLSRGGSWSDPCWEAVSAALFNMGDEAHEEYTDIAYAIEAELLEDTVDACVAAMDAQDEWIAACEDAWLSSFEGE